MIQSGLSKWSGLMPVLEHVSFSTTDKGDECSKRPAWLVCVAEAVTTAFFSARRHSSAAGCGLPHF